METGEKRKFKRLDRDAEISVKAISFPLQSGGGVVVDMNDVSEGGVRVVSPECFNEGTSLEVSLKLPGWYEHTHAVARYREENKPLTAVGRVKRCTPLPQGGYELGIEFTDIWEDHWKAMRQYLAELVG